MSLIHEMMRFGKFIGSGSSSGSGGGVSSWNDLTDKPFYEETKVVNEPLNITWDGNTDGLVAVEEAPFYKVSDVVLTDEQIRTSVFTFSDGYKGLIADDWDEMVVSEDIVASDIVFVRKDGAIAYDVVFPETGIYFLCDGAYVSSFATTEPVEHTKTIVEKLDNKYLPETYIRVAGNPSDDLFKCNLTYSQVHEMTSGGLAGFPVLGVFMNSYLGHYYQLAGISNMSDGEVPLIYMKFNRISPEFEQVQLYYLSDGTLTQYDPRGGR